MVLKPCTRHMPLSRAPNGRPLGALSVRFLYDGRKGHVRLWVGPGPRTHRHQECGPRVSAAHREPRPSSHAHVLSVQHERQPATHLAREGHDHHLERWPHCKTQPEERPGFSGWPLVLLPGHSLRGTQHTREHGAGHVHVAETGERHVAFSQESARLENPISSPGRTLRLPNVVPPNWHLCGPQRNPIEHDFYVITSLQDLGLSSLTQRRPSAGIGTNAHASFAHQRGLAGLRAAQGGLQSRTVPTREGALQTRAREALGQMKAIFVGA